ncbi:alkaline phosphatase family protein [Anaeromyxobacter paludicola]|uniref:Type I phosphodiesterase/nucleotide pyrophosphatase n=1 Tax=Anaeromyxobacter paludicola TaxID=2918171 RepID=A0ABM7X8T1_9BACT|nr:alkaline phosphatase family protein [Anaeromyxobacter paludicola]BDG08238.1 hypothetical protein AMPC_13510 [Anaeromyxobacter paludicola]
MRERATATGLGMGRLLARSVAPLMRDVLRPMARRGRVRPGPLEGGRRLLLIQLDGVSHRRLEGALASGRMPFLASRLARGTHRLSSCRSGAPASTPAFQAGLLYGRAPSVPGFVWYDRRSGREVRMDRATDAAAVELELSRGAPGLLRGGTSYFSIFSGDAALPHFCLSGLAGELSLDYYRDHFNGWDTLASGLVHTLTAARVGGRLAWEGALGAWDAVRWSASLGRWKHEPRFLLHRLMVGALMRELAVQGIIVDVARGVPVIFCDFLGFDEFGHRRGPESEAALAHLGSMDAALEAIFAAADSVPALRYDVFVLSDHGHVATRPFESYTGLSLPEYLALAGGGVHVPRALGGEEAVRLAQTRALRTWLARLPRRPRRLLAAGLDRAERGLIGHALGFARSDRVVTAEAGDLAHVYFTGERDPLPLAGIRARHPDILSALRECGAVGLVAVRDGGRGAVLCREGELDLAVPGDVARLPHPEPALLADYLAGLLRLPDSGDLVVLGWRGERREVVAYAWEFGSHGGVAPEEIETFVLHPAGCAFDFPAVRHPDALYRLLTAAYRTAPGRPRRPPGPPALTPREQHAP